MSWQIGKSIQQERYKIEEIIGGGGFGITYLAKDSLSNTLVAIKTLNATVQIRTDFPEHHDRFVQEAFRLAKCNHPHVVKILDVFREENLWCMVMEYIKGRNLEQYVEFDRILSEEKALTYIQQIGEALTYIHQQGFLHRDVKPANIMLSEDNSRAVLVDFGLVREFVQGKTKTHTTYRTDGFAPIEQYEMRTQRGAYTDVYALAATLYYLLTGKIPIPSSFRAYAELPSPQQHNPDLSDKVNAAIIKGMELEVENRPQTMPEWLELLKPPTTKSPPYPQTPNSPLILNENEIARTSSQKAGGDRVFQFERITVNSSGKIIKQEPGKAQYFSEDLGNGVTLDMVAIPGGAFLMGTEEAEIERLVEKYQVNWFKSEKPQHQVTIPAFYMGKFPVTQEQWQRVAKLPPVARKLKEDPSRFKGDKLPVESVSWEDAVEFCARLSKATRKEYGLPSEAQWEYACRAGTTTPFNFGETISSNLANYNSNYTYENELKGKYREHITEVGSFLPNGFGLYDMHGNVWEWCADTYHENYQGAPNDGSVWGKRTNIFVLRGGSWNQPPGGCRSSYRSWGAPDYLNSALGFRCVLLNNS
jgi:formylglycine-generating enzyme required for sulfatase activity